MCVGGMLRVVAHRMPDYISDFGIRVADKRLRSSSRNLLHVPRSSAKFGDCSLSIALIAGPTAWNSLPDHVKNASSLETFKSKLKTQFLNSSTAPFPSASAVLRRHINRLIIIVLHFVVRFCHSLSFPLPTSTTLLL